LGDAYGPCWSAKPEPSYASRPWRATITIAARANLHLPYIETAAPARASAMAGGSMMTYRPPHAGMVETALTSLPTRMNARPSTNEELLLGALDNCDVELGRARDLMGRILAERDALAVELTRAQRRECSSWCCAGTGEHTSFCQRWKALTASGMEARQGGDGETRLHRNDDSPTAEGGDAQPQSEN
jgi:hypothetical protein